MGPWRDHLHCLRRIHRRPYCQSALCQEAADAVVKERCSSAPADPNPHPRRHAPRPVHILVSGHACQRWSASTPRCRSLSRLPRFLLLSSAVEALVVGTASENQRRLVREALEAGHIALASGGRAVAVGGNAEGAIVTGDNNLVLSLDRASADAVRQAFAGLFLTRLHQLPPDLGDFTGRQQEVEKLVALLGKAEGGTAAVSALAGMGGAGKTA